jgi:hypothetical protein
LKGETSSSIIFIFIPASVLVSADASQGTESHVPIAMHTELDLAATVIATPSRGLAQTVVSDS